MAHRGIKLNIQLDFALLNLENENKYFKILQDFNCETSNRLTNLKNEIK